MLCDVVQLRHEGVRRDRGELRGVVPVRGHLQLGKGRPGWYAGQRDARLLAGVVLPGEMHWALPPLDEARVKTISGDSIIITGIEEIVRTSRQTDRYRQSWWCCLVRGGLETSTVNGFAERLRAPATIEG